MRARFFVYSALLFLVSSFPALLRAQFQQPTDEELKMTADPKAPGAAAVYLNVEEVTDDLLHFHSFYARIKVLQEKGKELATVQISYERGDTKVTDIKARTIHSDGTVIPLDVKPEDLLSSKNGDKQFGRMVFTLPSVEVGSILEYRYQVRYDDNQVSSPFWHIQRPYFVHKAHYAFTPFKAFLQGSQNATSTNVVDEKGRVANSLIWWPILPPGAALKTDSIGRKSLDLTDIPPIPDEEWMPPIQSILYKVMFYYKNAYNAQDFWVSEAKQWSKDVDHFSEQSKPIHEAVSGLIAPGDTDLDKAKKIYKAVQALDNTDYSRKKQASELRELKLKVAKRAEDTWTQKSGSSEDIALLYLAMVRAAGITAYAMKVVDRNRGTFDPSFLSIDQLDTTIVILNLNGNGIPVDPGEKMCPFQTLNWRHSGASGIRQSADGPTLSMTPAQSYTANAILRTGELNIDSHGGVTGRLQFTMNGQEALRWRQSALENDLDEVKKQFDRTLESSVPEGVTAHIDHFLALDDPDSNLLAIVKVEGTLGTATSKRLLLPGFFFETRGHQPFVDEVKRLEPVDMRYGEKIADAILYNLPPGVVVEGAPEPANNLWQGHAAHIVKTVTAPGQITIARTLARGFTQAKPEEYQDLRGFYQKVAAADQQQLVLTLAPPVGKGN
jgi:hypothetical protein